MEEKKANELYNNKAVEMDLRAVELSIADAETRKAINIATKEYNKAMVNCTEEDIIVATVANFILMLG